MKYFLIKFNTRVEFALDELFCFGSFFMVKGTEFSFINLYSKQKENQLFSINSPKISKIPWVTSIFIVRNSN